eukprot:3352489-Pyramimonas_sp.AAC.1
MLQRKRASSSCQPGSLSPSFIIFQSPLIWQGTPPIGKAACWRFLQTSVAPTEGAAAPRRRPALRSPLKEAPLHRSEDFTKGAGANVLFEERGGQCPHVFSGSLQPLAARGR